VHANLGEAYLRQSNMDEAAKAFRTALELDPNQNDPGANRARALLQGMSIVLAELERQSSVPAN
jgi:cytochrome c-type biogenesis protein CcmH/NrfG